MIDVREIKVSTMFIKRNISEKGNVIILMMHLLQ